MVKFYTTTTLDAQGPSISRARAVAADPANDDQLDQLSMADGTQDRIAEFITSLRSPTEGQVADWKCTPICQGLGLTTP